MGTEAVEPALGGQSLPADPLGRRREGVDGELIGAHPADLGGLDDPGLLEDAEVLDDGRQCHVERPSEVGDRGRTLDEAFDHAPAAAVAEGMEQLIERVGGQTLRYIPKY